MMVQSHIGRGVIDYGSPYLPGTAEWRAQAKARIGASSVPGIMGYGDPRYNSRALVVADKLGAEEWEGNDVATLGLAMEPYILRAAQERIGLPVHECRYFVHHPDLPLLGCDLDGYVIDDAGQAIPLEIKTKAEVYAPAVDVDSLELAVGDDNEAWPSKTQAEAHWAQLQCQMSVLGAPYGYLVILCGSFAALKLRMTAEVPEGSRRHLALTDRELRALKIPAFPAFQDAVVPTVRDFWRRYVEERQPVPVESQEDAQAMLHAWRQARAGSALDAPGVAALAVRLREAQAKVKELAEPYEAAKAAVEVIKGEALALLQDVEAGREGVWTLTAKTTSRAEYVCKATSFRVVTAKNADEDAEKAAAKKQNRRGAK